MARDVKTVVTFLDRLEAVTPFRYAQWLVEDPITWDYQVVAERIPMGADGYAIAHRTGVIGQVFRTGGAIAVPDTRSHPLYDPFDTDVDWELAIPVRQGESLVAVLNLEGSGAFELGARRWLAISATVGTMGWSVQDQPPDPVTTGLVKTRRATFGAISGHAPDVLKIGTRLTQRGKTVLAIGDFPAVLSANDLTACNAEAQGMPLAECVRGVGRGMDILQLGAPPDGLGPFERLGGWALVEGRYEFVLVAE